MCVFDSNAPSAVPSWDRLYEIASVQDGHFTTVQAAAAGYSPQLIAKYLHSGRIERVHRGVYRLVHYPYGDHDQLVVVWLWTNRAGVFSHDTALSLHQISDVLPAKIHITVPSPWKHRRLRAPARVVLHFDEIAEGERAWVGAVPVTNPIRTIEDCIKDHLSPDTIERAVMDARARGLVNRDAARRIDALLAGERAAG